MTLAPSDDRSVVTSTRAAVVGVDLDGQALTIELADGRRHRLASDELSHDRLAHGYAVTVHRSQGATHDTAHVLEDGGGRELAYVKMSRARDRTTVYAVADDLDQVESDLRREWGSERRQRWAIDTGTPMTELLEVEDSYSIAPTESMALRLARVDHERDVLRSSIPIDEPTGMALDIQRIQWLDVNPTVKAGLWGRWTSPDCLQEPACVDRFETTLACAFGDARRERDQISGAMSATVGKYVRYRPTSLVSRSRPAIAA